MPGTGSQVGRGLGMASGKRRRRLRRAFLSALVVLIVAMVLAACGGGNGGSSADVETGDWGATINPGGEPVRGGTLRIATFQAPENIDPLGLLQEPTNQGNQVVINVFDRLVEFQPGSLEPQPGLAERWEISEDGLTWTFHLRDAEFSNGMPVTSADVRYVLDFARGPDSFSSDQYAAIERIQTPDDRTVVLRLSHPAPGLLYVLATAPSSIVPSELVEEQGMDGFHDNPIGSGPFVIERWRRDQEVVLVRNETHWREGYPYLDEVRLVATPDDNSRVLGVQSGDVDIADLIPFSQIETVNKGESASVLVSPGADMNVVWINNDIKPFGEPAVRQALNYATPVDSISDTVFAGEAPRMNSITPKLKYWTDDVEPYPHGIERARELLAESSVPDGFSATVQIDGSDQASEQAAQILKGSWSEIGVELEIKPLDATTRGDNYVTGNYELTMSRPGEFTSDTPVPDQFADLLFDSPETNNLFTGYENPVTKRLTAQAVVETSEKRREELFQRLQAESIENPSVVPMVYTPNRAAVRDNVHDFSYLLNGWWPLDRVWIDD